MRRPRHLSSSSLWLNPDYLLLWGGQFISACGSQVSQVAFPLLVLALTHSPAQAGLTGALRAVPYLLCSLPAGVLVDRWDRKRVMIVCDLGRGLSLLSIPVAFAFGHLSLFQLNLVSLLEGTLFVFFNIAEIACLPSVVTKKQLPAAAAQNELTSSVTTLLGPLVSGVLFGIQQVLPFAVDAGSYLISVCSLLWMKTSFQEPRQQSVQPLWGALKEGVIWLWNHPRLRFLAIISGGSNAFSAGYMVLIILLAQHLGASSFAIGLIFTTGGVGWMLGALIAPWMHRRWRFWAVIIVAFWCWALLVVLYSVASSALIVGAISCLLFSLWPVCNTFLVSYRLTLIPDDLQGRVNSLFRLIAFSGQPLGLAATGLFIQWIGITPTILLTALGLALLACIVTLYPALQRPRGPSSEQKMI